MNYFLVRLFLITLKNYFWNLIFEMAAATDSPLSKRRNNISPVWSFFTICDDGRAKCSKCNFK